MKLLYILGTGHCGSTLLDMLLNAHPRIFGMGEVVKLPVIASVEDIRSKGFWGEVDDHLKVRWHVGIRGLSTRHAPWSAMAGWDESARATWSRHNTWLLEAVSHTARCEILVDGSKQPARLEALLRWAPGIDVRVVHLVRDGRAVINSYLRKYGRPRQAFNAWLRPSIRAVSIRRQHPNVPWLRLRYEDLCARPVDELRRLHSFVGVKPEDLPPIADAQKRYAGISGNRMRHRRLGGIRLDERWRHQLPARWRALFTLVGTPLNGWYGYPVV